jgi:hypothetical protein
MNSNFSYEPNNITVHIDRYRKTIVKEKGDIFYPTGQKIHPSEIAPWVGKHKRYYNKNYKIVDIECFPHEGHIFLKETIQK